MKEKDTDHETEARPGTVSAAHARGMARVAGLVAVLIGAMGIVGWTFGISILTSAIPGGQATMKMNTAVSFILAGASLGLQSNLSPSSRTRYLALAGGALVAVMGLVTMAEYLFQVELGVDNLLGSAWADAGRTLHPTRMAPNTALGFILSGGALFCLDARNRALRSASQILTIAALVIGYLACVGYLLSVTALYDVGGYASMAPQTAFGFVVLSVGALVARPDRGVAAVVFQNNPAGSGVRRLLAPIVFAPLALGWLRLQGEYAGYYGAGFGVALMVTSGTGIVISLALWNAHLQGIVERRRQQVRRDERFLLEISDLLQGTSASDVMFDVSKALARYLTTSRCFFSEIDLEGGCATLRRDHHEGLPSLAGRHPLTVFGAKDLAEASLGHIAVSNDTNVDDETAARKEAHRVAGIRSRVAVPLLTNGKLVAMLVVSSHEPRQWQPREIALIRSIGERTWLRFEALVAHEQFRVAIEAAPTGMLVTDGQGRIVLVSSQAERLFGYPRQELLRQPMEILVPARLRGHHAEMRASFSRSPRARPMGAGMELFGLRKDGTEIPIEIGLSPMRTSEGEFVLSAVVDITDRRRGEREKEELVEQLRAVNGQLEERVQARTADLTQALREREVLLKEIHHRVKNNLQVISSLINMQMRKVEADEGRAALAECRTRVEAIALIHEQLYQSKDYASVPFSKYARRLTENIGSAIGISPERVTLDVAVDDIALPVSQAIPCALILNELITNALKHAFPVERRGHVKVELRALGEGDLFLAVTDDGIGLPQDFTLHDGGDDGGSLGMQLVTALTEQLDGQLEIVRERGSSFRVRFAKETGAVEEDPENGGGGAATSERGTEERSR